MEQLNQMNLPHISDIWGQSSVGGGIVEAIKSSRRVCSWSIFLPRFLPAGGWLASSTRFDPIRWTPHCQAWSQKTVSGGGILCLLGVLRSIFWVDFVFEIITCQRVGSAWHTQIRWSHPYRSGHLRHEVFLSLLQGACLRRFLKITASRKR